MKILIGWPTRREGSREHQSTMLRWMWDDDGKNYLRYMYATPDGADVARSEIVEVARIWGAQMLIMLDDDITAARPKLVDGGGLLRGTPFPDAISFARQVFSRGYATVLSPTISFDKKLLVWPKEEGTMFASPDDIPNGLSEIGWGGLGMAFFDGSYISQYKVLDTKDSLNSKEGGRKLYCKVSPHEGEDKSLCRNIAESTGRKIGCDTRLVTDHWKWEPRRSWPGKELADAIRQRVGKEHPAFAPTP